ncbi:hypothetical protein [Campylobacter sp. CNRCH_2014_0184h]|uniref:hypothetical protein n=1 Tax=Campylobacter sp. CNRCH_2014_0184h TaxID=2911602 RepID=UPI0021E6BFF6|nr:hypothetical protein [Campylobacter sp. CNRCH_2014_0184h]MCV3482161.1 hypothetical protein [Campylobacter sp. CNRCH_2014_0184h]
MSVDMSSKIDELAHNIGEVINRADALMDKFEKNEGNIAGIEESLENKAKLLMQNLSWTVSSETESDTNFNTLQKALDEASKYTPVTNSKITIKLKTGFILSEEIRIQDRNIGFVTIISETETKYDVDKLSGKTIFYFDNSRTPYLLIKLSPNKADNGRTFIVGSRTSIGSIGGTFTNCPNVFFWDNGILSIRGIQVINATQSIGSSACSTINAAGSSSNENYTVFKNCTKALFSSASSDLYLESAKFENCVLNGEGPGFYFHRGGRALMINTKFINCKHTVSTTAFFQFNLGGMVQISNTSFNSIDPTNRCNIATNQTTPNGVFLVS